MPREAGTILVVDDNPGTLGLLTEALEREGFTVLVAVRGEGALASVQQMRPDLVLMDARMPEMDGFETCRRLKRMAGAASLPVVFMTGLSDTEHVIRGLEVGGVDYVSKPIVLEEVLARIRVHIAGARLVASAHAAMDAAGHALFAADREGRLRWATPAASRLLALLGGPDPAFLPEPVRAMLRRTADAPFGEMLALPLPETGPDGVRVLEMGLIGRIHPDEAVLRAVLVQESREETRLRERLQVTPREAEVLLWLARGKTNRDIAEILGLSPRTVKKHLERAYAKLGVENRASAVGLTMRALAQA
jgi:DNA-binding NarL/FixJ family response regulator